ncbi:MAG: YibE/F family protein [Actinobacteria bacterium]|nr:MAG: YibE/F family protein [Actinomycetota bacterium]
MSVEEQFWGASQRRLPLSRSPLVNLMGLAVAVSIAFTVIGLVELWPHDHTIRARGFAFPKTIAAKVLRADRVPCQGGATCRRVSVELLEGPAKGKTSRFTIIGSVGSLAIGRGDHIRVYENKLPAGAVSAAGHKVDRYSFSDFDRRSPMLWLAIAFASLLLFTGRLHGLRALIGLGLSLALVIEFVIPAILHGKPPVEVAVVGAFAVMLVTMPLSYGLGAKMISAWLGTAVSLLLAAGLASGAASLAHLSGVSSDESIYLGATQSGLSLRGLLVAGMVIGALGVLVDLTVSQASTVVALRRANPKLGFTGLFSGATEVGHDHIAATVNTLVFAYAGATLPVLLIFSIGGTSFADAVNGEAVAEQIIAALVGSIGLIASMPITTALAALLAPRMSDRQLAQAGHAHTH